jgi:hypothetical protein
MSSLSYAHFDKIRSDGVYSSRCGSMGLRPACSVLVHYQPTTQFSPSDWPGALSTNPKARQQEIVSISLSKKANHQYRPPLLGPSHPFTNYDNHMMHPQRFHPNEVACGAQKHWDTDAGLLPRTLHLSHSLCSRNEPIYSSPPFSPMQVTLTFQTWHVQESKRVLRKRGKRKRPA